METCTALLLKNDFMSSDEVLAQILNKNLDDIPKCLAVILRVLPAMHSGLEDLLGCKE
jgi:hypothetical protein